MSKRIKTAKGDVVIIAAEHEAKCEECGKIDELRPYGEGGKKICFDCGKKNPQLTERMMRNKLFGEGNA